MTASNITESSVSLDWWAPIHKTDVAGYNIYDGENLIGSTKRTFFDITDLIPSNEYNFSVKSKDRFENESLTSSNVVKVLNYCAFRTGATGEQQVVLNTINHTSLANEGSAGYKDFTSISSDLNIDKSYNIEVSPFNLFNVNVAYGVFIDYNQDGSFNFDDEMVILTKIDVERDPATGFPIQTRFLKETIRIPKNAKLGKTRMRIITSRDGIFSLCGENMQDQWSIAEDFTINITNNNTLTINENQLDKDFVLLFPIPAQNELNISFSENFNDQSTFKIVNILGQYVSSGPLSFKENTIKVDNLQSGVYFIEIDNKNGKTIRKKFIKGKN